jgi:hypothetical protein
VTPIEDPAAEAHLRELVGTTITDDVARIVGAAGERVFVFADGARLELRSPN